MDPDDSKAVALRFNDAINRRELDALVAVMTEDHTFIDSAGTRADGKDTMRGGWAGFFESFPDYRNIIDEVRVDGDVVVMAGHSECSMPALRGPALWRVFVRDGLVKEWRVYEDDTDARGRLGLGPRGKSGPEGQR